MSVIRLAQPVEGVNASNDCDTRDQPWLFRTYAGHSAAAPATRSTAPTSPAGRPGLSVAFDLPTQTGYDSDHPLARGEVGKVGVPIGLIGDMGTLFDGIPLERMNTSMTINATAPWLLALYIAVAEQQGADRAKLAGHGAERHHQGISVAAAPTSSRPSPRCG